jgi:nitroreductase/Pyruvate/2-oxoacid:ferredoxin oxidoreductase delta subunit
MSLLTIDESRCKRDGLCAAECPTAIISLADDGTPPRMVAGGEQACLRCGHCVAVCPHGALDHVEIPLADCPPIRKELVVGHEQAVQFLRSRRSVRRFKDKPVSRDHLQQLIETARYAPTGSNSQLVQWRVINDAVRLRELAQETIGWMRSVLAKDPQPAGAPYMPVLVAAWDAGVDAVLRSAPCLLVAHAPAEANNGMVDLTLALSYLELAAPSLGLGTCWAGLLQGAIRSNPALKRSVGIPDDHPYHYPMMVGYANVKYYRLPERRPPVIRWD